MKSENEITIKYCLSQVGQKNSLLAGGDGKKDQEIRVRISDYKSLLEDCKITEGGQAVLDLGAECTYDYMIGMVLNLIIVSPEPVTRRGIIPIKGKLFDELQTAEQLIKFHQHLKAYLPERKAALAKKVSYMRAKEDWSLLISIGILSLLLFLFIGVLPPIGGLWNGFWAIISGVFIVPIFYFKFRAWYNKKHGLVTEDFI